MAKQTNEEIKDKNQETADGSANDPSVKKSADAPESVKEKDEAADQTGQKEEAVDNQPDPAKLEELTKKAAAQASEIETLKKSGQDLNSRLLRAQADFDNFRKRTIKEKADARKFRAQDLVSDLLETLDNFKRALAVDTASEDGTALKKGMEMILGKFESALKKEGVEEIESLGKPFDPTVHQAVMQEESDEHDSGIVIQVLQAGYTLNGRVIRPAMVKVSQ
ncbi:nucleotide exchange factor GrpE [Sporolactobacillus shoreae]|uniref:Protein GrpE n=1 Tax=Sporolactobacillus shoreae TaxID=1465501 RepID=A0A4Z0GRU3_9BACL|nr:nucleotide exchange factor GrpE [Sporolactobacillus shoreae]TGA99571.1 nucleotide exchange factor GrpE [Sporolactobacillus shoreae]